MIGVTGIEGTADPLSTRTARNRQQERANSQLVTVDVIQISEDAQSAAARFLATVQSVEDSEIRREQIEEAQARLNRGSHKVAEVVTQVAARITRFI